VQKFQKGKNDRLVPGTNRTSFNRKSPLFLAGFVCCSFYFSMMQNAKSCNLCQALMKVLPNKNCYLQILCHFYIFHKYRQKLQLVPGTSESYITYLQFNKLAPLIGGAMEL